MTAPDGTDVEVVAVALDTLRGALPARADLTRRRREAARMNVADT